MESTNSDWEKFWGGQAFVIITDHTKPAMKWTISELKNRNKKIYVIDLSDKPEPEAFKDISKIPPGIDRAVIGVTKTEPGDLIPSLKEKGVRKIWLHWKTDTEKARETCREMGVECLFGHCPMMYLGSGLSIHGIHRGIAKMTGKY
ncbi:MAG: hypothetical protein ACPK85_01310 [Methanosarcina sp.]